MSRTEVARYLRAFADELHPSDTARSTKGSGMADEEDVPEDEEMSIQ